MSTSTLAAPEAAVDLFWLPLGAGDNTHCVRANGLVFEAIAALVERRSRCDLYHSALEVHHGGERFILEMAPVWSTDEHGRGVVVEGPVGVRFLGRFRAFRYEVRCWRNGLIPDQMDAVGGPQRLSTDAAQAAQILTLAPTFPPGTWGRDEFHAGEMWNSNSLVAWLLARSGHDMDTVGPPPGGRAPGWSAGLAIASRDAEPGDPGPWSLGIHDCDHQDRFSWPLGRTAGTTSR